MYFLFSMLDKLFKVRLVALVVDKDNKHIYQISRPASVPDMLDSLAWKTLRVVCSDRDTAGA